MKAAISDIITNSKVDFPTAKKIALALRHKYLPKVAEAEFGLDIQDILGLLNKDFSDLSPTNNNDGDNNDTEDDNSSDDNTNEIVDRDKDSIAKIELMVPESKLNEIQKAMESALGDSSFTEYVNIDNDPEHNSDDGTMDSKNDKEDSYLQTETQRTKKANTDRGDNNMTKKELMNRKAERENIVSETEMVLNDSKVPFDFNQKGQLNQKREWPLTKLENDGDNSLKQDTTDWLDTEAKSYIPSLNKKEMFRNQENLELFHFDSSPSGGLQYSLSPEFFEMLHNIPSQGVEVGEDYKVPTQMPDVPRRTIVLASDENINQDEEDSDYGMKSDDDDDEDDGGMEDESPSMPHENEDDEVDFDFEDDFTETADDVFEDFMALSNESKSEFISKLKECARPKKDSAEMSDDHMSVEAGSINHKETVAAVLGESFDLDKAETVLYHQLKSAGVSDKDINNLNYAQGIELANKIISAQSSGAPVKVPVTLDFKQADTDTDVDGMDDSGDDLDLDSLFSDEDSDYPTNTPDSDEDDPSSYPDTSIVSATKNKNEKQAQLREMRMRTAYNVWTQLAMLGVVDSEEVTDHVDNWLEEGLSVKAMISQGDVMLKTAKAASNAVRKATANSNNLTTRNTVSTTPAFYSGTNTKQPAAVLDLADALSGLFTRRGEDPDLLK